VSIDMNAARLARYEAGLSLTDAAEKAGVSYRTIARLEDGGHVSAPSAKAVADAYDVTVARLLGLREAA